ncbi:MAG: hypothetical protein J6A04_01410 [Clostridia bacterium]|nr:hypothetical protein [Clostridia bacterium]
MKTVIKEIIIVLLLILAILLVLGVFLYDYIPMNKVVPKIEQYEVPNNIKEELEESIEETTNTMTPIVYEINGSDLKLYEKTKDYEKGKVNPFADTSTSNVVDTNTTTSNGNNETSSTPTNKNNGTTITNSSSEGTYLPHTGTK